jgi:hypothetical protein
MFKQFKYAQTFCEAEEWYCYFFVYEATVSNRRF